MKKRLRQLSSILVLGLLFTVFVSAQNEYKRTQEPRYSPDGKLIIFSATISKSTGDLSKGIALMNADGTNVRTITPNVQNIFDLSPSISPNGSKIVFIRQSGGNKKDLFIINSDGSGLKQLTDSPEAEMNPEFTNDGKNVLFVRRSDSVMFGPLINGALISLNLETGKEQTILGKEFQVIQGFSAPRGLFLVLLGKLDDNQKPLPIKDNGTMITVVAPDGTINPNGAIALSANAKFVSQIRVSYNSGLTIIALGNSGIAEYFSYLITSKGVEKLASPSGIDYHLSPDASKVISWDYGSSVYVKGIKEDRGVTIGPQK
ncbi:MAG TPA: hypothetical protein PKY82_15965 [Pyrinomonadaceae bacterium]|nr:hypothetical protein [Pyrinomonadaceae bacterium]